MVAINQLVNYKIIGFIVPLPEKNDVINIDVLISERNNFNLFQLVTTICPSWHCHVTDVYPLTRCVKFDL